MTRATRRSRHADVGRFVLPDGLPDEYYAFTDGEIYVTVEKHGGINTIGCLDVFEKDGKAYPDRSMTPVIFQKEGTVCGKRPLYGPAVQFISTTRRPDGSPGRPLFHVPDQLELYPFGFRSTSSRFGHHTGYDMAVIGRDILFSFTNDHPDRHELVIGINKDHIVQGELGSLKNQVPDGQPGMDKTVPFEDRRTFTQTWATLGFDAEAGGFCMGGTMGFPYGDKGAFVLITADQPVACRETATRYFLTIPWDSHDRIRVCLVLATSRDQAVARAEAVLTDFDAMVSAKVADSVAYADGAPRLYARGRPDIAPFAVTAPSFLRAMVLAETDKEACIRAATHKFGYFIGWDQLWPAKALLLMGDWALAKKLVRYHITLTGTEHLTMAVPLIVCLVEDIVGVTGDTDYLSDVYARLCELFMTQASRAASNGLVSTSNTFGVDDPAEIGITGEVWAADLNGWWYAACRAMENLAILAGDADTQGRAHTAGAAVQQSYLPTFYNDQQGYLYCAVDAATGRGVEYYQNVSTIAMDTPYGDALLHPRLDAIARFQTEQLCHPAGRSAVAYWDNAHEMWKNCIMYQHITHEMNLARAAGLGDEISRMMDVYLGHFRRNRTAIETHNLVGTNGDIGQRASWQAFGARALYSGIVEGLIGIQADLGGFRYVPCNVRGRMAIDNWRFRGARWHIDVRGKGPYVKRMTLDGKRLRGTLKVPADVDDRTRTHTLAIERSRRRFRRPTLLAAPGAAIIRVRSDRATLSFEVASDVHTTLKFYSPAPPRVTAGTTPLAVDWDDTHHLAWVDAVLAPGTRVEVAT